MNEEGQFALVTGASSGIGLALCEELAKRGYSLLLVSNEEKELNKTADRLQDEYHVRAIPLCMDLAQTDSAAKLFDYCTANNIVITILINNAGIFFFNDIVDTPPNRIASMISLHVHTPAMLCRFFTGQMIRENRGGYILNIASIAAWMMMPGIALYSSTKSFVHCFSRAMRRETIDRGVSITTVCPGAAATGLYNLPERYMQLGIRLGIIMPTQRLARLSLNKMFRRKAEYIPGGLLNRFFIFLVTALPEWMIRLIRRKILKNLTQRHGGAEDTKEDSGVRRQQS